MAKFNFTDYMHTIAQNLKDIGHVDNDTAHQHFFRVSSIANLEEVLQNLPRFNGYGILVEDNLEGEYLLNGGNMILDKQLCGFWLIRKAELFDAVSRGNEIRLAEATMRKIVTKIRRDYLSDNSGTTSIGLRNIDWGSLNYFTFGPVIDNCYGVYCSFVTLTTMDYKYNPDDWQ